MDKQKGGLRARPRGVFLYEKKEKKMKDNILKKVQGLFEGAVNSKAYQDWQKEARQAWNFYDGEQWTKQEIDKLAESKQPAIVINKIAAKIDNIAGTEVAGRTRVVYRSRSGDAREESTARAVTDLALYVAERNDQAIEISHVFKAGMVTGIGWLDVGVENEDEGVSVFNRCEDEMNVVWDPSSRRGDFSDARFVCRQRWLDDESLKNLFPEQAGKLIKEMGIAGGIPKHFSGGIMANGFSFGDSNDVQYLDSNRDLYRVVEVQYLKSEKRYRVRTSKGKEFVTFERDVAFADPESTVESEFVSRVYFAYFSGNVLLDSRVSPYQHNKFTLVPYVYKRNRKDGRPYGLVRGAIDPQKELNKRRARALHLLNTAQVIADIDAVEDPSILAREAARPDGMILKRPGKELRILRNSDLAQSQVMILQQATNDIQEVMGVFSENIGKQSNATSGVAIQQRQVAGNMNQMFAFDSLRRTKKKMGQMILNLIRQFFTAEMVIQITDQLGAPRVVQLNQIVKDAFGNPLLDEHGENITVYDVRSGAYDIHVEEVRDVLSGREHELQQMELLRQAGVPVPPHLIVEATSLRNKDEILSAILPDEIKEQVQQ